MFILKIIAAKALHLYLVDSFYFIVNHSQKNIIAKIYNIVVYCSHLFHTFSYNTSALTVLCVLLLLALSGFFGE